MIPIYKDGTKIITAPDGRLITVTPKMLEDIIARTEKHIARLVYFISEMRGDIAKMKG